MTDYIAVLKQIQNIGDETYDKAAEAMTSMDSLAVLMAYASGLDRILDAVDEAVEGVTTDTDEKEDSEDAGASLGDSDFFLPFLEDLFTGKRPDTSIKEDSEQSKESPADALASAVAELLTAFKHGGPFSR